MGYIKRDKQIKIITHSKDVQIDRLDRGESMSHDHSNVNNITSETYLIFPLSIFLGPDHHQT